MPMAVKSVLACLFSTGLDRCRRRAYSTAALLCRHAADNACAAVAGKTSAKFQFDNCELVEVAWAPGAPAAACWRRLHRASSSWEAAEDALDSASSEAADQAF